MTRGEVVTDERAIEVVDDLLRAGASPGAPIEGGVIPSLRFEIVNDALRLALQEDQDDLATFEERAAEPILSYEELLNSLKAHGKL